MRVHFDESKSAIRLESSFDDISKVLEEWDEIILCGVRRQIADVASGLPAWCLRNNHIIGLDAMSGEMMMSERSCWGDTHRRHRLLLRD